MTRRTIHKNITNPGWKETQYWNARRRITQKNLFRKYRGQKMSLFTAYLKSRTDAAEIILDEMNQKGGLFND